MLEDLGSRFETIPRTALLNFVTPIEHLERLSADNGGARIYVKRDDISPFTLGGNKIRQLEYYLGDAESQNCDTILITGAIQSNFARLAAAVARKRGMDCHVQLEDRVANVPELYRSSGNVLLNQLLGATIHSYPDGEDEAGADRRLYEIAERLKSQGRNPYVIPLGPDHPPLGALGYVRAAGELVRQCGELGLGFGKIVVASGSGNTHAGLLFGLRANGDPTPVIGICNRRSQELQRPRIAARCRQIAELLDIANPVGEDDIVLDDSVLAPGYGQLNDAIRDAISRASTLEALFVDPVYTGRAMAGALNHARTMQGDANLLMVHTGGLAGLFAYGSQIVSTP